MGKVLIFGTNVASLRAAANFARYGHKVILLNRGNYISEIRSQLQIQQPRNLCNGCLKLFLKKMYRTTGNITVYHNSEILSVEGAPGNFKVKFKTTPPVVDEWKCIGCEICVEKCGATVKHLPLSPGIYTIPNPKNCVDVCPAKAINIPEERIVEESAEAVILAPEFEEADVSEFGYGFKNVLKSSEFELLFWGVGEDIKHLTRPSDGKIPRTIGFFAPAGFKNFLGSYEEVSRILWQAIKVKELSENVDVHVYLREARLYGKGQLRLLDIARDKGVHLHIIDDFTIVQKGDNIVVNGDELEMFVIAAGQKPSEWWQKLADAAGIEIKNGFALTRPYSLETTKDGVFAMGEFVRPLGNPESIYDGTAIVREVERYISPPVVEEDTPQEYIKDDFNPKVALFVCECALGDVSLNATADHTVYIPYLCLEPKRIISEIKKSGANRVVFAACSPMHFETKLEKIADRAGISPTCIHYVQLKEHGARVGADSRKISTLVRAAIEKVKKDYYVDIPRKDPVKAALVIGNSVAALVIAAELSRHIKVYLLADKLTPPEDVTGILPATLRMSKDEFLNWYESIKKDALSRVTLLSGEIESIEGKIGSFRTKIGDTVIEHGVLILADGSEIEMGDTIGGGVSTHHARIGAILAARHGNIPKYELMRSYSLLDLNPPSATRGVGDAITVKVSQLTRKIAEILSLELDEDGFVKGVEEDPLLHMENTNIKMRPFDQYTGGIFISGFSHSPMPVESQVIHGEAVAQQALFLMREFDSPAGKWLSVTNPRRCAGCGICVEACFTKARYIDDDEKIAKVEPALCEGCGACANVCPSGAAYIVSYRADQMFEIVKEVVK